MREIGSYDNKSFSHPVIAKESIVHEKSLSRISKLN